MHIGYLGVVIPEKNFWQGYFIDDIFAEKARDTLARVRGDEMLRTGSKVITKLHIAEADEPIVGNFCATIVQAAAGNVEYPESVIGTCGHAIHEIIDRKYFWIEGKIEDGGIRTSISPIYVSTIDEARDTINSLTIVRKIKRRLMENLSAEEGQSRVSGMRAAPSKRWPAIDRLVANINRRG